MTDKGRRRHRVDARRLARRQRLTSSVPAIPAEACGRFPFSAR